MKFIEEGLVERLVDGLVESKNEGGLIGGLIGGSIQITERQIEVLKLIEHNNKISIKQLAKSLGINSSAIDKHIEALKSKNLLERIGGTRGYWQINIPKE